MCKVIAIANQKGGVGKTTTTVNLGIGLARKGKRVVLIDADPQGSMTVSLGIDEPDKIEYSLANVLMDVVNEEEIDYAKIILKHEENIDFIPANIELAGLEVSMVNVMSRELVMKRFISNIKENYDYILIDCMPSLGMITINALVCANSVLIPVQASYLPVKGLQQLIKTISRVRRQINPELKIEGMVMTMVDMRSNYTKDILEALESTYGETIGIFDSRIPMSVRAAETSAEGKSIYIHDPRGKVAKSYEELTEEMNRIGTKSFRGKQIYSWLHEKLVDSFEEMTNLPKNLREKLDEEYEIRQVSVVKRQISKMDPTEKFLFELDDGNMIESVLMKYNYGNSVCISSQAGCRMGCRFCASTIDGLERNLTASEMLRQIYAIQKITGERVSNIVVMGSGEPLDNYDNFVRFVHMISDEHGLHISQRNITASTCGIIPNMLRLAEEGLQITLALSLHGSNQEKRKKLMPVANKYELTDVLKACDVYFEKTGRRVTFEYSLVKDVNDQDEDVKELAAMLKNRNCHLNLIPVNPIRERDFKKPDGKNARDFKNKLEKNGINVTIRRERGSDIDGACGQLRRRYKTAKKEN